MSDRKLGERIEKLLRLAAPSSNSTEAERISAALEAARLFAGSALVIASKPEPPPPRKKTHASRGGWTQPPEARYAQPVTFNSVGGPFSHPGSGWAPTTAQDSEMCSHCGETIDKGAAAWVQIKGFTVMYLHNGNGPCGW